MSSHLLARCRCCHRCAAPCEGVRSGSACDDGTCSCVPSPSRLPKVGDWAYSLDGESFHGPFGDREAAGQAGIAALRTSEGDAIDPDETLSVTVAQIEVVYGVQHLARLVVPYSGQHLRDNAEDERVESLQILAPQDVITATAQQWDELVGKLRTTVVQWATEHDVRIRWFEVGTFESYEQGAQAS